MLTDFVTDREVSIVITDKSGNLVDWVVGKLTAVHVCDGDVLKITTTPPLLAGTIICNVREIVNGVASSTVKAQVAAADLRQTHVKKFTVTGTPTASTHVGHQTL